MKKGVIIAIVIIVILGGGVLVWSLSKDDYNTNQNTETSNGTANQPTSINQDTNGDQQTSSSDNSVAAHTVEIVNMAFAPANITVKKGTIVTWTNKDDIIHTATSTSGPINFDSGNLTKDQSFSFTFNTAGTYNYHCVPHPQMTGTITVTE